MTAHIKTGDMLIHVKDNAIIVHGCNCRGKMGKGIALSIKRFYPKAYNAYISTHQNEPNGLHLGQIISVYIRSSFIIINAMTQDDYYQYGQDLKKVYSDYDSIRECFRKVALLAKEEGLSVHYPLIGAGLANGRWDIIYPIICEELEGIEHTLWRLE